VSVFWLSAAFLSSRGLGCRDDWSRQALLRIDPTGFAQLARPRRGWLRQSLPSCADVMQPVVSRWVINTIALLEGGYSSCIPINYCQLASSLLLFIYTSAVPQSMFRNLLVQRFSPNINFSTYILHFWCYHFLRWRFCLVFFITNVHLPGLCRLFVCEHQDPGSPNPVKTAFLSWYALWVCDGFSSPA